MVMTSCIPKGGRVVSVWVYPTEFGLKCMNIEATQGPSALIGADGDGDGDDDGEDDNNDDDEDDDDGEEEDSDLDYETENNKLRTYELNKLRLATKHRDTFVDYHLVYFPICLGLTEKSLNDFFNNILHNILLLIKI